ncbi:MAG: RNA polymerase sigma factor [Oscillospiraceae bacterium]|nr:RNA polymerase sigma factor [Oscillospiraceae bacterium]
MDGNKQEIAQWVRRLQNGDMQAFNSLYAATNDSGYFTALKILKDPDEAQDVLQESYIAVLEKIGDLQSPETFVSWFHQIVANRAKNALVKKKPALFQTQEQEQAYTDFVPDEDEAFQPQASVDQADLRDQVMQIVDGLSDDKRACVLLFYYNELSIADIAATMDVPENTVKTRLFQARKDIRKGVEALQKKNVCLRSAAPVSLVIWALRMAQKSEGGAFSAGPAAALVLQEVTAASAGTAAAGAAGTAATAGTFVAKLTAMTAAQKVIAGVVAAGIVTGAAAGTTAVVRNREPPAEPAAQAVVSMTEPAATVPQTWETLRDIALTEMQTAQVQTETTATSRQEETQSTTVSQTAAKETASAAGSTTVRVTGFTVPSTAPTTKAQTTAPTTTTTTRRATTTTQKASETTTTATAANTHALTPAPTTATTTAATTTTTTTTKPKGTATVTVQYSVADYADSGAVTFTVEEGSAITTDMVIAAVRSKLEPTYGSGIEVFLRSGSAVAAADPTAYSYEVLVYAD